MPHLVPLFQVHRSASESMCWQIQNGGGTARTRHNLFRCKVIVEPPLRLVAVMTKTIPLAATLNVQFNPIVKCDWTIRMVRNPMFTGRSPKGRLGRKIHGPTVRRKRKSEFCSHGFLQLRVTYLRDTTRPCWISLCFDFMIWSGVSRLMRPILDSFNQ